MHTVVDEHNVQLSINCPHFLQLTDPDVVTESKANPAEHDVHVFQLVSNKVDLEEYGLDAIFQAEDFLCSSNHASNFLILFRNEGKRFKHVFIV